MKMILYTLIAISVSQSAFAATYLCKSDKQAWTAEISINEQTLVILDAVGPNGNGILVYENAGLKRGQGSMANNFQFGLSIEKSTAAYPTNNSNSVYFVQPQLLKGASKGLIFGSWKDGGDVIRCGK